MQGDLKESPARTARICLDLNVFFADLMGRTKRIAPSSCSELVDMAMSGLSSAGGFQLIVSQPMIEQWANLLQRYFSASREDAEQQAALLAEYASQGPLQMDPLVVVASDFVPFASEQDVEREAARHLALNKALPAHAIASLYDELEDDRHVFLTAFVGKADVLVTANLKDFRLRTAILFDRDDVLVIPNAGHSVVVAAPSFTAYWLKCGVVPNARFLDDRPSDFRRI